MCSAVGKQMCSRNADHTVENGPHWRSVAKVTQTLTSGWCLVPADRNPQGHIKGKSPKYSHVVIRKCSFNKTHYRLLAKAGAQLRPRDQHLPLISWSDTTVKIISRLLPWKFRPISAEETQHQEKVCPQPPIFITIIIRDLWWCSWKLTPKSINWKTYTLTEGSRKVTSIGHIL